ncbi:MAG: hypothetical protein EBS99_10195 [Betaproteobacteria bacterium]|nr:hypothetical protein [Betaproteobacteria bacterium]
MTSSDAHAAARVWADNPLINGRQAQSPAFVRSRWDEGASTAFGPWRIAPATDPAQGLTSAPALPMSPAESLPPMDSTPVAAQAAERILEPEVPTLVGISEQELEQARSEAYSQGLAAGIAQERAQVEAERERERELIRHLGIELRALNQDTQRFFEPLRRLALHVAEQLVRAELQVSGKVVSALIEQAITQLEQPGAKVVVSLNPDDAQRLQALGATDDNQIQIETDATLREGSVRARVNDSMVQDLIEHRLEPIARRLLSDADAWLSRSALAGTPASASTRVSLSDADRDDVLDVPSRPAPSPQDPT